ncbi:MAG: LysM peptidoglycan-binding domain-containing protein [Gammaproteobacteria bacterium]|nr:MAG: LysM peptidoglycan-binding domain-containing protein [Gammaproteobacteria bacterium]TLZ06649.1 MAG: LysM peptidoglycan-binding domain-containing protein [Gammaproteobacteria bacterium]TLZ07669.1 MAG: LysM peptidoglycan-binding domain-containing protein [Gammaproteobacteria bacterium]
MRFAGVRTATAALSCLIAGCSLLGALRHPAAAPAAPVSPGAPQEPLPLANERFELEAAQDVVGVVQVVRATKDDTLTDIARRFNVGYEELLRANPKVDPWLPGEGREIVVPTQFILPDAPRAGLVINIAAMRIFYYPPVKRGERAIVITHPIGIGKVGWRTPEGVTKIVRRQKDPTWRVPESVRKEHHDNGEDLDPVIGPGPENPLGKYAFYLQWPSYLIHGTNKPAGVGLRSSHGCIRLYPEDIEQFYDLVPIGTQVRVVNQPFVFGWRDAQLYMQPFDVLEDDTRDWAKAQRKLLSSSLAARLQRELQAQKERVDWSLIASLASNPRGVPVPITDSAATMEQVLAAAPRVRNVLPEGSTWDGKSDLPMDEASFKQMLSETEPAAPAEEGGAAGADAPGAAAKTQPLRPKNGG